MSDEPTRSGPVDPDRLTVHLTKEILKIDEKPLREVKVVVISGSGGILI